MYQFILTAAWVALGGCWPMSKAGHKLDLVTARDSQAIGSSTTNDNTITVQTVTLAKEINTTLAGLIVLLTIGSYWLLMRYTPTLSNEIILPSKLLGDNIAAVLSLTWPKHYIGSPKEKVSHYPYDWVLFYKQWTGEVDGRLCHQILGFDDFKEQPTTVEIGKSHMVIVKAFSPVMKSLVQIAIWNHVSLWLVLVMIINTLVYNGFLSHSITNDSVLRLVLVGVYAVASIGHRYRTTTLLYRNFTSILLQTCWTIICKKFIFGDNSTYERYTMVQRPNDPKCYREHLRPGLCDMIWRSFDFELFGRMELLDTYQDLSKGNSPMGSQLRARDKIECSFDKFVKPIREAETKAYEKATDSALEKVLANVAVLLAICLATALAPWNSIQTISADSAQLGSYALLLSISAGFLALISSMTQLTNATESARVLLLLQEKTLTAHGFDIESQDVSNEFWLQEEPKFSLSKDIKGKSQLTSSSLWRSMSLLERFPCFLLGPALMLMPRMHGDRLSGPDYGPHLLTVKVQGVQFACRTVGFQLGRIARLVRFSPDAETRQQWENMYINAKRECENIVSGGRNENDNIVEHQQENPGTSGNSDTSDAHK